MALRRAKATSRNRRRDAEKPRLNLRSPALRRVAGAAGIALAVIGALLVLRFALNQPVERVSVSGRFQRVQALEVEKAVRQALAGEGMAGVDLAGVARAVEAIAWVDRASVARSWPRALTVQVVEHAPVARWGEAGLVNLRGEMFVHDARHVPAELPELVGPEGQQVPMTGRYLAAAPRLTEAGMRLTRLTLDARGAWEMTLDNGVTLRLGREQVDERFERFMRAGARIVATRAGEIDYVDLRYANGFAVGWRSASGGVRRG
jgi:cell division protein FtsQ